eukprot:COSAG01_NODE_1724_length_9382_cov_6.435743_1_plen_434_part_00
MADEVNDHGVERAALLAGGQVPVSTGVRGVSAPDGVAGQHVVAAALAAAGRRQKRRRRLVANAVLAAIFLVAAIALIFTWVHGVTEDGCRSRQSIRLGCAPNGRCELRGGKPACLCASGWAGDDCARGTGCDDEPCQNGATCTASGGHQSCACAGGWAGDDCQLLALNDSNIRAAVSACLAEAPVDGECTNSAHGPMPQWDVSRVRDMHADRSGESESNLPFLPFRLRRPALLFLSRPSSVRCGLWSWVRTPRWDRPQLRAAADARVRDGVGARAVFNGATAFNGDLSAWNVGNVLDMNGSACGPASAVPNCPRCVHPTHGNSPTGIQSPPAADARCLGGGGGASSLSRRALSHRGARTPDHKIWPQRCYGRVVAQPLRSCVGRWVAARSVLQRRGFQWGPVGVERWQRPHHELQCVRPRLRRPPAALVCAPK